MRSGSSSLLCQILPEMRHPEVPRSHQRDEGSGVQSVKLRNDALRAPLSWYRACRIAATFPMLQAQRTQPPTQARPDSIQQR